MRTTTPELGQALKKLIAISRRNEVIYETALRNEIDEGLSYFLRVYSEQKWQFLFELDHVLSEIDASDGMRAPERITAGLETNIESCIEAEKKAEEAYLEALVLEMSADIRQMLERHCAKVRETLDRLDFLRRPAGRFFAVAGATTST